MKLSSASVLPRRCIPPKRKGFACLQAPLKPPALATMKGPVLAVPHPYISAIPSTSSSQPQYPLCALVYLLYPWHPSAPRCRSVQGYPGAGPNGRSHPGPVSEGTQRCPLRCRFSCGPICGPFGGPFRGRGLQGSHSRRWQSRPTEGSQGWPSQTEVQDPSGRQRQA